MFDLELESYFRNQIVARRKGNSMGVAVGPEQEEIASLASGFASRYLSDLEDVRGHAASGSAIGVPAWWKQAVDAGLLSLHLPVSAGGSGLGIEEAAVVAEAFAYRLAPGAVLPTLIAGGVLAAARGEGLAETLGILAGGGVGAVVRPGQGLTAVRTETGWRVDGLVRVVWGLNDADVLLLGALCDEGPVWFQAPVREVAYTTEPTTRTDLSRDAARLTVDGLELPADRQLAVDAAAAETVLQALTAAEAAGLMRWTLEMTCDYARVREQFGRPIGAFQATKHKLALMAVATEIATAAAWSAAASLRQDATQQQLAASGAAVVATAQAPRTLADAVTVLGGIGFTWEHDVHLYLRRALSNLSMAGTRSTWAAKLGELSLTQRRELTFDLPDQEEFRAEVAELLDRAVELPSDGPGRLPQLANTGIGERRNFLVEHRLVASHWPPPYGRGATAAEQIVVAQEYVRRGLDEPNMIVGEWAVPTILAHGTEDQKQRFVRPTLRGELFWCQLFSEPGAGSDLASLSTKATKAEGGWRLDGQKVWTSGGNTADFGICLARTNPGLPNHKGLGFLLLDMASEGVDVRPIKQSNGEEEFCEVFLDGAFVPDENVVGEPGEGWKITMTTLANERTAIGSGSVSAGVEGALLAAVRSGQYAVDRTDALRALGELTARSHAIGAMGARDTLSRINGIDPGVGSSLAKVATALAGRQASEALMDMAGPQLDLGEHGNPAVREMLSLPEKLTGGGTVEIQLNVIAERILGLPR